MDHFYSVAAIGQSAVYDRSNIVVATSTQTSSLELRITDGAVTKQMVYNFCEYLAGLVASSDHIFTDNTPFTG